MHVNLFLTWTELIDNYRSIVYLTIKVRFIRKDTKEGLNISKIKKKKWMLIISK